MYRSALAIVPALAAAHVAEAESEPADEYLSRLQLQPHNLSIESDQAHL